jgi:flagellar biosynthesis GTPase FlhF
MRYLSFVLAGLLLVPGAKAESVYKCFDRNGRVVYQSLSCASANLKDGGQIEPPAEVQPEEAERIRAETERTRARLEAKKKAEEKAEAKVLEERRVQALERQAQAAEEQARAAERQARAAEEGARAPNVIYVPAHVPPVKRRPSPGALHPPQPCAPGDLRCR